MKRLAGAVVAAVLAAAGGYAAFPASAEPAVDSERYRTDDGGYAFQYHYDGDRRDCAITDGPATIRCEIAAPAGTRITVAKRTVRPTAIEVTDRGWRYLRAHIDPEERHTLPEGARLSVLGTSCTALREGGLECLIDGVGFRESGGVFGPKGKRLG